MRTRLALAVYAVAAVTGLAAQNAQQPTFRAGANYVRVDMYATEEGQPIQDLRPEEVEILEDGVPQTIEDFEHVIVRPAGAQDTRVEPDGVTASRQAAGDPRARVFVIFLDTYHTQLEGSANVRQPLVRFLERVLGPDDLVALMTPEMAGSDIALGRKTTVISRLLDQEWWGRRARVGDEDPKELLYRSCGEGMKAQMEGDPLAKEQRVRPIIDEVIARRREKLTLDAIDDLMTHLAGLRDERKAVVVVTEGWLLYRPNPAIAVSPGRPAQPPIGLPPVLPPAQRGTPELRIPGPTDAIECEADRNMLALIDHERRLREITDDANRGNVTFYPVYARGLAAFDAPIGPDKPPSVVVDAANLRTRHDSMRALAEDTDGHAIINTNNIAAGLKRIADDLSSYYLLGYYSTNARLDGRFRSITVRVTRPGVRVRARRGYRGRTAEELVAASAAADPSRQAVETALNRVAGINARSTFRIRPSSWARGDGGAVWLVGELDYRTRKELAWTAGAEADVTVVAADGRHVVSTTAVVPAGQGTFGLRLPDTGALAPGEYAVNVRLRPESGSDLAVSDTARIIIAGAPSRLGEAVMWRRGPSTGRDYLRTADPRFQRSERLRLEMATDAEGAATARLLDRAGKPMQVPVQVTVRTDDAGMRWVVADATLAPLAAGDYAVEVTLGNATQVTGFRVVP